MYIVMYCMIFNAYTVS